MTQLVRSLFFFFKKAVTMPASDFHIGSNGLLGFSQNQSATDQQPTNSQNQSAKGLPLAVEQFLPLQQWTPSSQHLIWSYGTPHYILTNTVHAF